MGRFAVYPILSYKKKKQETPVRPSPSFGPLAGWSHFQLPSLETLWLPSGYVKQFATENGPVEIVDD